MFPLNKHYFHIKINDGSKTYNPETQTVLDIATALNFFCANPVETKRAVGDKVRHLVSVWNEKNKDKSAQVNTKSLSYYAYIFIRFFKKCFIQPLFFILFQNRSHFSDYTVLAEIEFKDKKGVNHESHFVLIVSNWHFVRDNQERKNCPPCKSDDCNISIKLSSTSFKAGPTDLAQGGGLEPESKTDDGFFFDRSGVIIPYSAFVSLMEDARFTQEYLPLVRKEYERLCGRLSLGDEDEGEDEDDGGADVDAEAEGDAKKSEKKTSKKTSKSEKKSKQGKNKSSASLVVESDIEGGEGEDELFESRDYSGETGEFTQRIEEEDESPSSAKRTRVTQKSTK